MTFRELKNSIESLEKDGMKEDAEIIMIVDRSMFKVGGISWFVPSKDVLIFQADHKTERPAKAFKEEGEPFWE